MTAVSRGWPMLTHCMAVAALAGGLLLTALTAAGPAWAHATRIGGSPADDAEVAQSPPKVSATFNETMQPEFAAMTVIGPDGSQWEQGAPTVEDAVISVGVRAGAPAGTYTVNYRATSADGHVVTGSWSYRVTAAPAATSSQVANPSSSAASSAAPSQVANPASPDRDGGVPAWPFAVAAIAVVAVGAVWAVRRKS